MKIVALLGLVLGIASCLGDLTNENNVNQLDTEARRLDGHPRGLNFEDDDNALTNNEDKHNIAKRSIYDSIPPHCRRRFNSRTNTNMFESGADKKVNQYSPPYGQAGIQFGKSRPMEFAIDAFAKTVNYLTKDKRLEKMDSPTMERVNSGVDTKVPPNNNGPMQSNFNAGPDVHIRPRMENSNPSQRENHYNEYNRRYRRPNYSRGPRPQMNGFNPSYRRSNQMNGRCVSKAVANQCNRLTTLGDPKCRYFCADRYMDRRKPNNGYSSYNRGRANFRSPRQRGSAPYRYTNNRKPQKNYYKYH